MARIKGSENEFPKLLLAEGAAAATPAAGLQALYVKSADGLLYAKDDAGAERVIEAGASVPTGAAIGDLLVWDGSDWIAVTVGADDDVLTADSAEAAGVKWAPPAAATPATGATVTRSSTQSIAINTETPVSFDTEVIDDDGYWASSPNPTRLTAPADGWYLVAGTVKWTALTDLGRQIFIKVNNSVVWYRASQPADSIHNDPHMAISGPVWLDATDYAEICVFQNKQAGGLNIAAGARGSIVRI